MRQSPFRSGGLVIGIAWLWATFGPHGGLAAQDQTLSRPIAQAAANKPTVSERPADRVIEIPRERRKNDPPVVTALAVSIDGQLLATGGDDHMVRIWNLTTGALQHELRGHADWVRAVVFHPTDGTLVSAGDDRGIRCWNPVTGSELRSLPGAESATFCLNFSPDGKRLVESGFENKIHIYDYAPGQIVRELECPAADVRTALFSPRGDVLIAGGRNGRVRLWRTNDFTVVRDVEAHRLRVRALAFSPDGSRFATGGDDRQIRIWDTQTGNPLLSLPPCPAKTQSLVFCGADRLASGGSDNLVRLWDLSANSEVERLVGHTGSVAVLGYHAPSGALVSGSFDTTTRVWLLKP